MRGYVCTGSLSIARIATPPHHSPSLSLSLFTKHSSMIHPNHPYHFPTLRISLPPLPALPYPLFALSLYRLSARSVEQGGAYPIKTLGNDGEAWQ